VLYMKRLAGLDMKDKRKPQTGNVRVSLNGQKKDLRVTTAGSAAGETMLMPFVIVTPGARRQCRTSRSA